MLKYFKLRKIERELAIRKAEFVLKQLKDANNAVVDKTEPGWVNSASQPKALTSFDQMTMQEQAQYLYYKNPHARSVIRNLVKFIAGQNVLFQSTEGRQAIVLDAMKVWKEFRERSFNSTRLKELFTRTFRDGECFIRFFVFHSLTSL